MRAFPSIVGCDIPSLPAIVPEDYAFDSCGVPEAPLTPFARSINDLAVGNAMGTTGLKSNVGAITGYWVVGRILEVETSVDGIVQYKAQDCHGGIVIDEFTTPINAEEAGSEAAEVGDVCMLGYDCDEKAIALLKSPPDKGLHQGDIPQMITDEEKAWGPARFGP
jgi:hypothetical protein